MCLHIENWGGETRRGRAEDLIRVVAAVALIPLIRGCRNAARFGVQNQPRVGIDLQTLRLSHEERGLRRTTGKFDGEFAFVRIVAGYGKSGIAHTRSVRGEADHEVADAAGIKSEGIGIVVIKADVRDVKIASRRSAQQAAGDIRHRAAG